MEVWGEWEFSPEFEEKLNKINLKLSAEKSSEISKDWLALLNYDTECPDTCQMEVDVNIVNSKEEEIMKLIKEALSGDAVLRESAFTGISINVLNRLFSSVTEFLDDFAFCSFCKFITTWENDILIEQSMRAVVLPKLKEGDEASGCITFSIKELAISKPDHLCQNVLIPLIQDGTFTDVELLSGVFSVLPTPQKDLLMLSFTRKVNFHENDWLLLYPLIKDLSQNSLLNLLDCIQTFSHKFTKSQAFGRFLVNFCKSLDIIGSKDILREVIEKHETLLKVQALKYLELV